jgi:hypothetical protein
MTWICRSFAFAGLQKPTIKWCARCYEHFDKSAPGDFGGYNERT